MSASILLVEDDEKCRRIASAVLERHGYRVLRTGSGEDALAQAALGGIDLVLLDIQLPGIDGFDVLARLRALHGERAVPIVAMTASVMLPERNRVADHGFDDVLWKPWSMHELVGVVERMLAARSSR